MLKLAILASTKANDMQAVIDAIEQKKLNAEISVVISNKADAYALERARKHGIKSVFLDPKGKTREDYDKEISKILDENKVGLILLIGYMKYLSPWFVGKYRWKIMNIHPSLLPKFAGGMDKNVHQAVLDAGEKTTGCTLHFVDEGADTGPIIMQKEVKIERGETADTLKEKVQKAEQEVLLKAVKLYSEGKIKMLDNKAVIS